MSHPDFVDAMVAITTMAERAPPGDAHGWFESIVDQTRAQGFDATDYLYQSCAYQAHDVGTTPGCNGDTDRVLATIKARSLIVAPPIDLFNPVAGAHPAADAIPCARFVEIPSQQGHAAATN